MIVECAIGNVANDLERMSDFHLEEDKKPDRHKIAGFISKWVAKERPIQLRDNIDNISQVDVSRRLYWANADLAVKVFQIFLRKEVPFEVALNLRYWFAFRDERGETLALIAYCCEEMSK
uniref:Uncharacterized protein n=1 Tax=Candidatus Kentrum sp. LFY TaxID=2126342 RepID=A0A450UY88_9GAMM|nr:MAG: hypothetical protein BECKLFY1418B_GA0070995_110210 [Candidatus Kentron sp. LFY]